MAEKEVSVQILGEEKHFCPYCKKETKMQVLYNIHDINYMKKAAYFGLVGVAIAQLRSDRILLNYVFIFRCKNCSRPFAPDRKEIADIKSKYHWRPFGGFKGVKEEKVKLLFD